MIVHDLQFVSIGELMRCFERVMDQEAVEDCLVEPETRRLRFLAPAGVSERLIERIYLDGGLTWCSRHPLEEAAEADAGPTGRPPAGAPGP